MSMTNSFQTERIGYYDGQYYAAYVDTISALVQDGDLEQARPLLEALLTVIEAENYSEGFGVDLWYYEQLANIYHAQGDYTAEIGVLERYQRQRGSLVEHFAKRIASVRLLLHKVGA
jgi:tetratricopeptide (TPR) repeat protein